MSLAHWITNEDGVFVGRHLGYDGDGNPDLEWGPSPWVDDDRPLYHDFEDDPSWSPSFSEDPPTEADRSAWAEITREIDTPAAALELMEV